MLRKWTRIGFVGILSWVASATTGLAQNEVPVFGNPHKLLEKFPPAPAVPRTVYAPLVRSLDFPHGELALNNRSPMPTEVELFFFTQNGKEYGPIKLTLEPGSVRHLDIAEVVPPELERQKEIGGIAVSYTGQWNQIASQLTLSTANRMGSVDQPLRPFSDFASDFQHAVWFMPPGARATIAIGNASDAFVKVLLDLPRGGRRTIALRPHGTHLVEIQAPADLRGNGSPMSVRLQAIGPRGAVRALGLLYFDGGFARTIRFYDRATVRQPDLFAAHLPTTSNQIQMVLKNVGEKPIMVTPRFLAIASPAAPVVLESLSLSAGQEISVDLQPLLMRAAQDPAFARVGVHVVNSGENGSLIGSLSTTDLATALSLELPLRDSGSLRNSGGSYPVRLDDDFSTIVSIMNVSNESVEFVGNIRHKDGNYVFPPRNLEAGQSVLFDIRLLRDTETPDPMGNKLPTDLVRGQFNWSMFRGSAVPKLIGRSQITSQSRGISSSYSCPVCCPDSGPSIDFNPYNLTLFVDGFQAFSTNGSSINCYGGVTSWPEWVNFNHDNASIATAHMLQTGTAQANGFTPGNTVERTDPYLTVFYYDDGMDCYESYGYPQSEQPVEVGQCDFSITPPGNIQASVCDDQTRNERGFIASVNPSGCRWVPSESTCSLSGTGHVTIDYENSRDEIDDIQARCVMVYWAGLPNSQGSAGTYSLTMRLKFFGQANPVSRTATGNVICPQ
jgi:hypothetical protein